MDKNKTQVITIPVELSSLSRNAKFSYVVLKNLLYCNYVCSVNSQLVPKDYKHQCDSIIQAFLMCAKQNEIELFKNDAEKELFNFTLSQFDRNMINKNEHIVCLKNALKSTPNVDKHQLLALFSHISVECALQLKKSTDTLNEFIIREIISECCEKMMVSISNNIFAFFVNEIIFIYRAI